MTYHLSFVTKKGSSFRYKSSHVLRGRVGIEHIFVRGSIDGSGSDDADEDDGAISFGDEEITASP